MVVVVVVRRVGSRQGEKHKQATCRDLLAVVVQDEGRISAGQLSGGHGSPEKPA